MKKSTILIIFVLAAMILGVVASASASPYADGANAIDRIRVALDKGNKAGAESALADLRAACYAGMRDLAAKGDYSDQLDACISYATQAVNGAADWEWLLDLALTALKNALKPDLSVPVYVPAHS